jgi:hypothetical protein
LAVTDDDLARYLIDSDELLGDADDLRAWVLAGQLEAHLKSKHGEAWWRSAEAGKTLKALWANANALGAQEIAVKLGDPKLRPEPLLARLGRQLKVPIPEPVPASQPGEPWNPVPVQPPKKLAPLDAGTPPPDGGAPG